MKTKNVTMVVVYSAEIPVNLSKQEIYEAMEYASGIGINTKEGSILFEKEQELVGEEYAIRVDKISLVGNS